MCDSFQFYPESASQMGKTTITIEGVNFGRIFNQDMKRVQVEVTVAGEPCIISTEGYEEASKYVSFTGYLDLSRRFHSDHSQFPASNQRCNFQLSRSTLGLSARWKNHDWSNQDVSKFASWIFKDVAKGLITGTQVSR